MPPAQFGNRSTISKIEVSTRHQSGCKEIWLILIEYIRTGVAGFINECEHLIIPIQQDHKLLVIGPH